MDPHSEHDMAERAGCAHGPQHLCCNRCAPLPCSCADGSGWRKYARSRWEGGCRSIPGAVARPQDCMSLDFMMRSSSRDSQAAATGGKENAIKFDTLESGARCGNGITYQCGTFFLCDPGMYHFDVAVCIVTPKITEETDSFEDKVVPVALGICPLAAGFSERYVYARVPMGQASSGTTDSHHTISLSGDLHVCGRQCLYFVLKTKSDKDVKIRSTHMNPDKSLCTWVSIRQVCRDCNPCAC